MGDLITTAFKYRFMRFLCTGGINTAVTYVIYLLLLKVFNYQLSYTIAYVTGIAIAYFLNKIFVFTSHQGWKTVMLYPFVYAAQYLFGMFVMWFAVSSLGLNVALAPLVVVVLSIPLTYWLSSFVFVGSKSKQAE